MKIRPYILAGGRSSRMGRDKAMLSLGGRTLLRRAVDTLRSVPMLGGSDGRVIVTVVGERTEKEGADCVIADGYPGCGPLSGMEAALLDLTHDTDGEFAFFLPVDMPFLPSGVINALLQEWVEAGQRGAKVCYVHFDGRPQPLVSMIHKTLHPFVVQALTAGRFKVTPVLESATEVLASLHAESLGYGHSELHTTNTSLDTWDPAVSGWTTAIDRQDLKRLWFSNLNNEQDFRRAETFATALGSN